MPNQAADNYIYDANGSLVENVTDSIRLSWNVQKKVDSVRFTNANPTLYYTYDAQGNRLSKRTNPDFANYYVRDAQGNALATYALKKDSLYLIEQNLYGSSRLGVKNLAILAQIDTQRQQISDTLRIFEERVGAKNYELSNHLGNVLATIGDKTIFNTDHYNGIVYSAQLYYPFGWEIPTLSYAAKKYRFGFNGKEDDREWHAQDYGFRLYTPRESRFISVDPITAEYPELTPYQFASNSPIVGVDLDGLEEFIISKNMKNLPLGEPVLQLVQTTSLYKEFDVVLKKNKKYDVFLLPINMDNKDGIFFTDQMSDYIGFPSFRAFSAHGEARVVNSLDEMSEFSNYFDISEVKTTFNSNSNKKLILIVFDGRVLNPLRYI